MRVGAEVRGAGSERGFSCHPWGKFSVQPTASGERAAPSSVLSSRVLKILYSLRKIPSLKSDLKTDRSNICIVSVLTNAGELHAEVCPAKNIDTVIIIAPCEIRLGDGRKT